MTAVLIIISILALPLIIIFGPVREKRLQDEMNTAMTETNYRLENSTLYVDKRSPYAKTLLSVRNHNSTYITGYVPEEIHIGSVTVGGVTTGGVYKTGGYNKCASGYSGKCRLFYLDKEVEKIVLSEKLASEAKNSSIKDFMQQNTIVVVDKVKYSDAFYALTSMGRTTEAHNVAELDKADAYPSAGKCEAIIRWLSQ